MEVNKNSRMGLYGFGAVISVWPFVVHYCRGKLCSPAVWVDTLRCCEFCLEAEVICYLCIWEMVALSGACDRLLIGVYTRQRCDFGCSTVGWSKTICKNRQNNCKKSGTNIDKFTSI
ncbi:MAG: hypothetical protein FWD76_05925 [Firmicutes bacterium]|nr:hypothetical protein [Bacillota bacterium]